MPQYFLAISHRSMYIGWSIQISLPARFTAFNLDDINKIPILWFINSDFLSGKNGKRKYCNKAKERKANLSLAMAKMYYTTNTQITESELYGRSISLPETVFIQGNRRLRPPRRNIWGCPELGKARNFNLVR